MSNEKLMSNIEVLRYRYSYYSKKKKGQILEELESQFSVDRKYLIRLLGPRKGGRPKTSGHFWREATLWALLEGGYSHCTSGGRLLSLHFWREATFQSTTWALLEGGYFLIYD